MNELPDGVIPVVAVIPVQGDGSLQLANNHMSLNATTNEHSGPVKKIVANQDSLCKYLSWEDPLSTIGSYIGAMIIIFAIHYLPITQLALKAGATLLGAVTLTEFIHRNFTSNTLLARLRPSAYKKIPESTLNDTLRDIHSLVQYAVVEFQRILFGQNLEKTFVAFVSITALFWLNKLVSPFGLALISLTAAYVAPLLNSVPGRELVRDAGARAEELRTVAVDNTQKLAQDGKAKASELSSKAQDTAVNAQQRAGELAQSGKQATVDLSTQAKDTTSYAAGAATDNVKELPIAANNAAKRGLDTVGVALGGTGSSTGPSDRTRSTPQSTTASNMPNNEADMASQYLPQDTTNTAKQSATQASNFASTATEKARQMAPAGSDTWDPTYTLEHTAEHLRDTSMTVPRHAEVGNIGSVTEFLDSHVPIDRQGTKNGVMDRSRNDILGAPLL